MAAARSKDDTPAMRQFHRFKEQHPDCVLFFRMGDFYEMFYDDAKLAARVLGVTLTQRTAGIPMAGVPYHAVESYLRRMIQAGFRVAVCDQVEDPALAKGVVKRDVTRLITPGTLTDESLLADDRQNPLAALLPHRRRGDEPARASLAWAELSTGAFQVATLDASELTDELARIAPSELLYPQDEGRGRGARAQGGQDEGAQGQALATALAEQIGCPSTARPAWQFRQREANDVLRRQFQVATLEGFDLSDDDPALGAASAVVHYLLETQKVVDGPQAGRIAHLKPPRHFARSEHLVIDQTSLRSLEIERTVRSQSTEGTLLGVLQQGGGQSGGCRTAMGKRTLRDWLCYPLAQRAGIEQRQNAVAALVSDSRLLDELGRTLDDVQDVQRIISRVCVHRALPRDLVGLGASARQAAALTALLAHCPTLRGYHARLEQVAAPLSELAAAIAAACVDSPPGHLRDGGLIRDGCDAQLDEYRGLQRDSNAWLARYQKELIDQTGIASLKVGFNKVFGYYIEITAAQSAKLEQRPRKSADPPNPADASSDAPELDPFRGWTRKQTLKNAERFITPALKEYEGKVLSAEQRAVAREQELFAQLCVQCEEQLPHLHAFAESAAELDVLACFARRAVRCRYVRPTILDEPVLDIRGGRHPVLDAILGDRFVPNDVTLGPRSAAQGATEQPRDVDEAQTADTADHTADHAASPSSPTLALITGPNMAGKSTYIRQAALITLMAHTGSFVPADSATIGLCDRIFTRIGASDELHAGQSTFMVEMTETANICHHVTAASLVILDEIGRGTSTLDGLALAWAIAEHLAMRRCRTLFATHYHELTDLADPDVGFDNVMNLNVTVRQWQDQVVFLHRIAPGRAEGSYGIHVAKIAGLPASVVTRADAILSQLEVSHNGAERVADGKPAKPQAAAQMSLFTEYVEHPVVDELRHVDLDALTPLEAFDLLRRLRGEAAEH